MEDAPPPFWAPGGLRFDKETSAALDAAVAAPLKQTADPDTRLQAKWNAAYEPPEAEAYDCMIADEERANKYQQAIKQRMAGHEGEFVVIDIGTGLTSVRVTMTGCPVPNEWQMPLSTGPGKVSESWRIWLVSSSMIRIW